MSVLSRLGIIIWVCAATCAHSEAQQGVNAANAIVVNIESVDTSRSTPGNLIVIVSIDNTSDKRIVVDSGLTIEVRDASGDMPHETDRGCGLHFFSACYDRTKSARVHRGPIILPPNQKIEVAENLSSEYELQTGHSYTAIPHYCVDWTHKQCISGGALNFKP